MKTDKLHYSTRKIDGYNKPFNFIISEREAGKSTAIWLKVFKAFKEDGRPSLVIRRMIADITDVYIESIAAVINKFNGESVTFEYKKSFKDGAVDIKINGKIFFRIIALSNPLSRIKSLVLLNLKYIIFDEFICNTNDGEKYLENEAFKFNELFNTFQRESDSIKVYFMGNPYSVFNPYFMRYKIRTRDLLNEEGQLKHPFILVKDNSVVECYEIKPELRAYIIAHNPIYSFDESYKRYALDAVNVNDINIKTGERPDGYRLKWIFRTEGEYIGFYINSDYTAEREKYYCDFVDNISERRSVFCFDFKQLTEHSRIMTLDDRLRFLSLKDAIGSRDIVFSCVECYYLIEKLYRHL